MVERSALPALDEPLAVQRLLDRLAVPLTARAPYGPAEPEAGRTLLARLEQNAVHGRLARIEATELSQVAVPTLALLRDSRWLLITAHRPGGVIVEDAEFQPHSLSIHNVSPEFAGLVFDKTPELPAGATVLSRIARLIWQHRGALYALIALTVLMQVLSLLGPQLTRMLIDDALPQTSLHLLYGIAAGMVLLALLRSGVGWLEQQIVATLQIQLDASLERGLLAHVMRLPYRFLEAKSIGQLMQGFQGLTRARTALTADVLGLAIGALTALTLLVALGLKMPAPALLVAAVGALSALIAVALGTRQETLQREIVAVSVNERERALELLGRITTLKAAGAAGRAVDRWTALLQRSRILMRQSERLTLTGSVAIELLGQMQLQLLWIWGGLRVLDGTLSLGELIAFTLMAALFHAAVSRVAQSLVKLRGLRPHLEQTESLLAQRPLSPRRTRVKRGERTGIEIRDLWFRYGEDRPWIFEGLNLFIAPGEMHHLHGPSGFGKTTLLKLVAGLYEPASGKILIDGRSPREARDDLIFVPQHVRTFNASVRENLALFSGGASFPRLQRVAELTGLAHHVQELPMGYETLVAHGGGNFSGGQRQIIVLTAALASDKPVLLLDEATANLDAASVRRLVESPLFQGRTVLHAGHERNIRAVSAVVRRTSKETHS